MNIRCVCRRFFSLAPPGALLALLCACGQYGELYLPEKPAQDQQPQPVAAPARPDTTADEDEEQ
jgi:predicted small lipoprotein YifL